MWNLYMSSLHSHFFCCNLLHQWILQYSLVIYNQTVLICCWDFCTLALEMYFKKCPFFGSETWSWSRVKSWHLKQSHWWTCVWKVTSDQMSAQKPEHSRTQGPWADLFRSFSHMLLIIPHRKNIGKESAHIKYCFCFQFRCT